MNIKELNPPLDHRDRAVPPSVILLHATAGATAKSSIDHLRGIGLSYHYIIARDGKDSAKSAKHDGSEPIIFSCVPVDKVAFHCSSTIPVKGTPSGRINNHSIGISLANIQTKKNPEDYPPKQLAALEELVADLIKKVPSLRMITTHAKVQPWNRADPLAIEAAEIAKRHGLEFWVPTDAEVKAHTPKKK
jgi:N-acetyl-anhydromuramyl-L-alanine amidase AmpD